ncbi:MAG: type II secretion system F family protein [Proteobacteria bacterium]|nr:type II secretion system F family protein [Pseudomonadota bacterium]
MFSGFFLAGIALLSFGSLFFLVRGLWPIRVEAVKLPGVLISERERLIGASPAYRIFVQLAGYLSGWIPESRLQNYFAGIRKKLISAGSPLALAPPEFFALKVLGALAALILGLCLGYLLSVGIWIIAAVLFGFFYPDIWLRDKRLKRQRRILKEMPYQLDLLTLAVEAGLDFSSGLERMIAKAGPGPLRDEFFLTLQEMKMGRNRMDSLKGLAERIKIPDISTLISALVQAEEMGSGLGPTLRIQSDQLRNKRFQRAEKLAMEAPVKMIFPLLFIFVCVFFMLFGSVILSAFKGGIF